VERDQNQKEVQRGKGGQIKSFVKTAGAGFPRSLREEKRKKKKKGGVITEKKLNYVRGEDSASTLSRFWDLQKGEGS